MGITSMTDTHNTPISKQSESYRFAHVVFLGETSQFWKVNRTVFTLYDNRAKNIKILKLPNFCTLAGVVCKIAKKQQ